MFNAILEKSMFKMYSYQKCSVYNVLKTLQCPDVGGALEIHFMLHLLNIFRHYEHHELKSICLLSSKCLVF